MSALAKYESAFSSLFCRHLYSARSACSYFCSRSIWPQWPPCISTILCMDFRSFLVTSLWCNCSFLKAEPTQLSMRRVANSVYLPSGQIPEKHYLLWVYLKLILTRVERGHQMGQLVRNRLTADCSFRTIRLRWHVYSITSDSSSTPGISANRKSEAQNRSNCGSFATSVNGTRPDPLVATPQAQLQGCGPFSLTTPRSTAQNECFRLGCYATQQRMAPGQLYGLPRPFALWLSTNPFPNPHLVLWAPWAESAIENQGNCLRFLNTGNGWDPGCMRWSWCNNNAFHAFHTPKISSFWKIHCCCCQRFQLLVHDCVATSNDFVLLNDLWAIGHCSLDRTRICFEHFKFIMEFVPSSLQCFTQKGVFHHFCQSIGQLCTWMYPT